MADSKITALAALTTADPANDMFPVVDVSDTSMAASGTTKRISINNILACSPSATLASATITGAATVGTTLGVTGVSTFAAGTVSLPALTTTGDTNTGIYYPAADTFAVTTGGTERYRVDSAGNLGIGVTPSAWGTGLKVLQVGARGYGSFFDFNNDVVAVTANLFWTGSTYSRISASSKYAVAYYQDIGSGAHQWLSSSAAGTNGVTPTMNTNMTLDASGNLLVGTTSGTFHRVLKNAAAGTPIMDWVNFGSNGAVAVCTVDRQTYSSANAAACALRVGDAVGARSINASGTINASGADYAEYMTKSGDFTIAKGDVAGIDANGKLTNVFADAVSFVVKSTDPSYVGNDKWGTGIEGDALEAARQLVDRIAFAGQVPVNVIGAKAGDYIVPVVDGTGIKGIAVTSPTFEQYQLAVGKVIAIDTDGRVRIIVKVA